MTIYKIILVMTAQLAGLSGQPEAQTVNENDLAILSALNAQFIKNFVTQDTLAHTEIIHADFVCINSDGSISDRNTYMNGWSGSYKKAGYTQFGYTDEFIRIFGNMALVRSRTVYTKMKDGHVIEGSSVYTDTYIKENGRWWCVQAQITGVGR
jgi:hypothetical protein